MQSKSDNKTVAETYFLRKLLDALHHVFVILQQGQLHKSVPEKRHFHFSRKIFRWKTKLTLMALTASLVTEATFAFEIGGLVS